MQTCKICTLSKHITMTENTKNKFAELLKAANDKATLQKVVTKIEKRHDVKPIAAPVPAPVKEETKPELSSVTIDDLLNVTNTQPAPNKPNLSLVDYSDKAFAVIGDTYPLRDKLKTFGGRFNYNLTCGAGWIFPKTKAYTVRKALNLI